MQRKEHIMRLILIPFVLLLTGAVQAQSYAEEVKKMDAALQAMNQYKVTVKVNTLVGGVNESIKAISIRSGDSTYTEQEESISLSTGQEKVKIDKEEKLVLYDHIIPEKGKKSKKGSPEINWEDYAEDIEQVVLVGVTNNIAEYSMSGVKMGIEKVTLWVDLNTHLLIKLKYEYSKEAAPQGMEVDMSFTYQKTLSAADKKCLQMSNYLKRVEAKLEPVLAYQEYDFIRLDELR